MAHRWFSVALLAALAAGCGGTATDGTVPVAGAVTVDGSPSAGATVSFVPVGDTKGGGGTGRTDPAGRFQLAGPRGEKGVPPGQYKVTVKRPLNPDGTPGDPNVPEMDSPARESLPDRYSHPDKTGLTATVEPGKTDYDFPLTVKKR